MKRKILQILALLLICSFLGGGYLFSRRGGGRGGRGGRGRGGHRSHRGRRGGHRRHRGYRGGRRHYGRRHSWGGYYYGLPLFHSLWYATRESDRTATTDNIINAINRNIKNIQTLRDDMIKATKKLQEEIKKIGKDNDGLADDIGALDKEMDERFKKLEKSIQK